MSASIEGILNYYKHRKITFLYDDDGNRMTSKEAKEELKRLLRLGHKLIKSSDDCVGFDPFGGGCPGHEVKEEEE